MHLFGAWLKPRGPRAVDRGQLPDKSQAMDENRIEHVRRFNREVTRRIGALSDDYLRRGRSLAEPRLHFEIGLDGADVRNLRTRLALESGYLRRLLRELEAQKPVEMGAAPDACPGRQKTERDSVG